MSLSKKLILSFLVILLIQSTCIAYLNIQNTRYSMSEKMRVSAQETATYLSLILSRPMRENNLPEINSTIDAIFDSGNYQEITVKNAMQEALVLKKLQAIKINTVPKWFINTIPLDSPRAEATIMDKWMQNGTISVKNSPNYTYELLYHNTIYFISLLSIIALTAMAVMVLALHVILRPLEKTKQQAKAVALREFPLQKKIPGTSDIKSVVLAMNDMVGRLKEIFGYQAKLVDDFREKMYTDEVTGLSNRRYFMIRLETLLKIKKEFIYGAMFAIKTPIVDEFEQTENQENVKTFKQEMIKALHEIFKSYPASFASQYNENHIILFIPFIKLSKATSIANELLLLNKKIDDVSLHFHIGLVAYAGYWEKEDASTLLEELRATLTKSKQTDNLLKAGYHNNLDPNIDIEAALHHAISNKTIEMALEPVLPLSDNAQAPLHYEVRPCLKTKNQTIVSNALFAHMLEHNPLSYELDKLLIEKSLSHHKQTTDKTTRYVLKLTSQAIKDHEFLQWLSLTLKNYQSPLNWLGFEISELCAMQHLEEAKAFTQLLNKYNIFFGLFHVGREFGSLDHMRILPIHHLKINGTFIHNIDTNENNQHLIKLLHTVARTKGAEMIAELVGNEREKNAIMALTFDGYMMS